METTVNLQVTGTFTRHSLNNPITPQRNCATTTTTRRSGTNFQPGKGQRKNQVLSCNTIRWF